MVVVLRGQVARGRRSSSSAGASSSAGDVHADEIDFLGGGELKYEVARPAPSINKRWRFERGARRTGFHPRVTGVCTTGVTHAQDPSGEGALERMVGAYRARCVRGQWQPCGC